MDFMAFWERFRMRFGAGQYSNLHAKLGVLHLFRRKTQTRILGLLKLKISRLGHFLMP